MTTVAIRSDVLADVGALVWREWRIFRRTWLAPTVGSALEPVVYLLVFGYGFGALVAEVAGIPYLDFMATGAAANAVLLLGLITGTVNGFFRRTGDHLYDGFIAAPVRVGSVVAGEALWTGLRAAAITVTTLVVAHVFGVALAWSALLAPVVGLVAGFGFACLGAAVAARMRSDQQLDVVVTSIFTPMFLISWTFFPLDDAPTWLRWSSQASPLTHVVALLRAAAFGVPHTGPILISMVVVLAFAGASWLLAVRWLRGTLVSGAQE
jgi:lipooligosaccharide transport system permease protein